MAQTSNGKFTPSKQNEFFTKMCSSAKWTVRPETPNFSLSFYLDFRLYLADSNQPLDEMTRITNVLAAARRIPENYHNMPRRFVDRHTTFVSKRSPNLPQYMQKIFRYKNSAYYDEWRPWQDEFKRLNQPMTMVRKVFVEPKRDWSYFRGDRVEVLKGPDKGKQGIINYIVKERNWVFVQGLNMRRTVMNKDDTKMGNVICQEEPYLVDVEVKLVDPGDLEPTCFEWRYDDQGERVRVSTRTERIIPIPAAAYETYDYVEPQAYKEQPKDTPAKLVTEVTFKPEVKTFEMDICEKMGIKDERVPYPMYWY